LIVISLLLLVVLYSAVTFVFQAIMPCLWKLRVPFANKSNGFLRKGPVVVAYRIFPVWTSPPDIKCTRNIKYSKATKCCEHLFSYIEGRATLWILINTHRKVIWIEVTIFWQCIRSLAFPVLVQIRITSFIQFPFRLRVPFCSLRQQR